MFFISNSYQYHATNNGGVDFWCTLTGQKGKYENDANSEGGDKKYDP